MTIKSNFILVIWESLCWSNKCSAIAQICMFSRIATVRAVLGRSSLNHTSVPTTILHCSQGSDQISTGTVGSSSTPPCNSFSKLPPSIKWTGNQYAACFSPRITPASMNAPAITSLQKKVSASVSGRASIGAMHLAADAMLKDRRTPGGISSCETELTFSTAVGVGGAATDDDEVNCAGCAGRAGSRSSSAEASSSEPPD